MVDATGYVVFRAESLCSATIAGIHAAIGLRLLVDMLYLTVGAIPALWISGGTVLIRVGGKITAAGPGVYCWRNHLGVLGVLGVSASDPGGMGPKTSRKK